MMRSAEYDMVSGLEGFVGEEFAAEEEDGCLLLLLEVDPASPSVPPEVDEAPAADPAWAALPSADDGGGSANEFARSALPPPPPPPS